jgi:hypothetical protein
MGQYLDVFHRAYKEAVRIFLPSSLHGGLLRVSLLEHGVVGLVSTQYGAGYEYTGEGPPTTRVDVSSRRVEYMLVADAPARIRNLPSMFAIGGTNTAIMYMTLEGAFPFRLTTPSASIRLVDVGFRVRPWERRVRFAELFADRTTGFWSAAAAAEHGIQAARQEADLALLDVERADQLGTSIGLFIRDFKSKTVLVLGDYAEAGADRLNTIREALVHLGYQPVLVKDVPEQPHSDLQQKLVAIASIARFIVVDDSSASGHLVEFPLVQANRWVTLVLRLKGADGTFMTRGASVASNVIRESIYTADTLHSQLLDGVQWAEAKLKDLEHGFQTSYPWRSDSEVSG